MRRCPSPKALLAAAFVALAGACGPRHPPPPEVLTEDQCRGVVDGSFGNQDAVVLAVRPFRGGTVFTPEVFAALARLTARLQREAVADAPAVLSLTSVPLMRPIPRGVEVFRIGDELPASRAAADALRPIVYSFDLVVGNIVNAAGTVAFVHIPRVLHPDRDLRELLKDLRRQELETLLLALDDGDPAWRDEYREVAGGGPSSDHVAVLFQAPEAGGMKEPRHLRSVLDFQRQAELHPGVVQAWSITDDLMLARRYLFRGNPAEAKVPERRAAVTQALLAWSLSGNAEAMGARLSSDERVALVRVGLKVPKDGGARDRLVEDLKKMSAASAARTGLTALVCP